MESVTSLISFLLVMVLSEVGGGVSDVDGSIRLYPRQGNLLLEEISYNLT